MFNQINFPKIKKFLSYIFSLLIIVVSIPFFVLAYNQVSERLGLKLVPVPVVGTGSMYPSLFWDKSEGGPDDDNESLLEEYRTTPLMYSYVPSFSIFNYSIDLRHLNRGDIIAFKNESTAEILASEDKDQNSGFVKRIIAVPGDIIELRDGYVILNNDILDEPYIYKPRSTYGGEFLADCDVLEIPENKVFVLGDNRKLSDDSRFALGLVDFSDIGFVLPFDEQEIYQSFWRDTSEDESLAHSPSLDLEALYTLINQEREYQGIPKLTPKSTLETSSRLRAQTILDTNDFSIEASRSGYTMEKALIDAGYSNVLTGEFISQGFYTAEELMQNIMYFKSTAAQIVDPEFDDIGFSAVVKDINSCPVQAIVGHIGGYVPAEYPQEVVASWKELQDNLNSVIPSWEAAKEYPNVDQDLLNELLGLLYKRRDLAEEIYGVLSESRWLTDDQQSRIDRDDADAKRITSLINQINQK